MVLDTLLEQYSCHASFERMRISGNPKKEKHIVCKAVTEGISPAWKMSFQNSGKLANMNVTTFNSVQCDTTHCKHAHDCHGVGSLKNPR